MTEENGAYDRRKPPAPHCYRVVQLGVNINAEIANALAERTCGEIPARGRRVQGCTLFEPKVGGGGHLLLLEDQHERPWARVLVEPDGPMVNLVAVILDGEWEASDETLAAQVRDWLKALHKLPVSAFEAAHSHPPSLDSGGTTAAYR
jgi:hypothetical protein